MKRYNPLGSLHAMDPDVAQQAVPGHGVPSQDPNPEAQVMLSVQEAEREVRSSLVGGGLIAGAALGAALGAVMAAGVGIVVGGAVGAVLGACSALAAGVRVRHEGESMFLHY